MRVESRRTSTRIVSVVPCRFVMECETWAGFAGAKKSTQVSSDHKPTGMK